MPSKLPYPRKDRTACFKCGHITGPAVRKWQGESRYELGRAAEDLAAAEATRLELRILDRNWRTRWGELDLVGLDGDQLVVVEVKCRRTPLPQLGPAFALNGGKRLRLARLAGIYLQRRAASHGLSPARLAVRFDVCLVVWAAEKPEVTWIKDAFRPR